jgi:peptidoglycan/xylan/chitin deacetylase (PgdA/CDA1 family)
MTQHGSELGGEIARQRPRQRSPLVLMYHSVAPYADDPYHVTVSPERFEEQMRWLGRRGLRGVSMTELLAAQRRRCDDGLVGLTFDDGYADFLQCAVPVLRRHGFTATAFVIAGRLGGVTAWDARGPRKPLLTAREVQAAVKAGIEIGSHGLRHVSLTDTTDRELARELRLSRRILADVTGTAVSGCCYPYGHVDARVADGTADAGYAYACAIWASDLTGPYVLPRVYAGQADGPARLYAKMLRHRLTSADTRLPEIA